MHTLYAYRLGSDRCSAFLFVRNKLVKQRVNPRRDKCQGRKELSILPWHSRCTAWIGLHNMVVWVRNCRSLCLREHPFLSLAHTHTHARTHTHTHTLTHTHARTHTRTHARTHARRVRKSGQSPHEQPSWIAGKVPVNQSTKQVYTVNLLPRASKPHKEL